MLRDAQVVLTPLAEDYGRKYTFTASCALLYIFQIPIALAPNYATLVVCRFIGGFVASPIFNVSWRFLHA
jgi:MFS family permease